MEVISLDSDEEDVVEVRSSFVATKTIVTPKRNGGGELNITTIQSRESNTLNTSIDLDSDIYDLILGKKESDLRRIYGKEKEDELDVTKRKNDEKIRPTSVETDHVSEDDDNDFRVVLNAPKKKPKKTIIRDDSDEESDASSKKGKVVAITKKPTKTKSQKILASSDVSDSEHSDTSITSKKRKHSTIQDSDDDSGYDSCSSAASTQSAKERSKIEKEFLRRAKGSYALDEIYVHVDSNLTNSVGGKVIREQLELHLDQSKITICDLPIAHSIRWLRHLPLDYVRWLEQQSGQSSQNSRSSDVIMELTNYCLIRIPGDTMIELIQANSLVSYVQAVKSLLLETPSTTLELYDDNTKPLCLILLVEGLHSYIKSIEQARYKRVMADVNKTGKSKKAKNDDVPALANIERALLEIQLIHGVRIFETANAASTVQFIAQMTKNLAEAPYKKRTSVLDFKTSASAPSSSENGRKKPKLSEVWRRQLTEIPSVSEKIANVVANKYPTVKSLINAYDKCTGNGENMLKDLQVDQKRKVGPAASKSIYDLFGQNAE
jgi:hypothetical protein